MRGPLLAVSSKARRASLNLPRRDIALLYLAPLQERSETVPQVDEGSLHCCIPSSFVCGGIPRDSLL